MLPCADEDWFTLVPQAGGDRNMKLRHTLEWDADIHFKLPAELITQQPQQPSQWHHSSHRGPVRFFSLKQWRCQCLLLRSQVLLRLWTMMKVCPFEFVAHDCNPRAPMNPFRAAPVHQPQRQPGGGWRWKGPGSMVNHDAPHQRFTLIWAQTNPPH